MWSDVWFDKCGGSEVTLAAVVAVAVDSDTGKAKYEDSDNWRSLCTVCGGRGWACDCQLPVYYWADCCGVCESLLPYTHWTAGLRGSGLLYCWAENNDSGTVL